jgi:hypothetical protein
VAPLRRGFVDLRPAELEAAAPVRTSLFLGRLDPEALRREIEDAGILAALAARGYARVQLRTSVESGEHRLRIIPAGGTKTLVDLRLTEATTLLKEPRRGRLGLEVLSFLSMNWLTLQDPDRPFAADRPQLPGQDHPGLGLARAVYERLLVWAEDWGKDGLLNFPEYFHNALIYAPAFRFISPARAGRFRALRRDLAPLAMAEASWAVEQGRVREEPAGTVVSWEPAEMVAAISHDVRRYLDSEDYERAIAEVADQTRYRVDAGPGA